jgi:hypothetical protein
VRYEDESETLFPSANDPPLEENTFPIDLSPPTSQDPPDQTDWVGIRDDNMDSIMPQRAPAMTRANDVKECKAAHEPNGSAAHTFLKEDYEPSGVEHEPGYAWANTKAVEEHRRALEQVTDRNFNLSESQVYPNLRAKLMGSIGEFGDLFDDRKKGDENGSQEAK